MRELTTEQAAALYEAALAWREYPHGNTSADLMIVIDRIQEQGLKGMPAKNIGRAIDLCEEVVSDVERVRWSHSSHNPTPQQMFMHVRWMAYEAAVLLRAGRIGKSLRWLGFMQGVLWATGKQTIEQLKEMNKPPEERDE